MKSTELKNLIKGAVREAIQEELKEILLEAVKAPRVGGTAAPSQVMESTMVGNPTPNVAQPTNQTLTEQEKRDAYSHFGSREFHKCEIHRCSTYGCLNCGQYTKQY